MEGAPNADPVALEGERRTGWVAWGIVGLAVLAVVAVTLVGGLAGGLFALLGTLPTLLLAWALRGGSQIVRWLVIGYGLCVSALAVLGLGAGMAEPEAAVAAAVVGLLAGATALFLGFNPSIRRYFGASTAAISRPSTSQKTRAPRR